MRRTIEWALTVALAAVLLPGGVALAAPPPNDDFANATPITDFDGAAYDFDGRTATLEPGEPTDCMEGAGASGWYRITPSSAERLELRVFGFSTALYTGDSLDSLTLIGCNQTFDLLVANLSAGTTYSLQLLSPVRETTCYLCAEWDGCRDRQGPIPGTNQYAVQQCSWGDSGQLTVERGDGHHPIILWPFGVRTSVEVAYGDRFADVVARDPLGAPVGAVLEFFGRDQVTPVGASVPFCGTVTTQIPGGALFAGLRSLLINELEPNPCETIVDRATPSLASLTLRPE